MKRNFFVLVALITILPGCDWLSSKKEVDSSSASAAKSDDHSPVLLSIDGKPVVTVDTFEKYFDQMVASDPRFQSMIQLIPDAKQNVFSMMANEEILLEWGRRNKIHERKDYKEDYERALRMLKRGLTAKHFEQDLIGNIKISDKEVREYYDQHKDLIPDLVLSQGGVKAKGFAFDKEEKAKDFYDKVKEKPANFDQEAKQEAKGDKKQLRDFGLVNDHSFSVDKNVRKRLTEVKTFPSVLLVVGDDKKHWVVLAVKKEDVQYRKFDDVKDQLAKVIEREKGNEIYMKKIVMLKKEYNVKEDDSYFEKQKAEQALESVEDDGQKSEKPSKKAQAV